MADDASNDRAVISAQAELAAKAIKVPEGFTLKTVASEPNLANGVAFCFDPAGRIFVAETYRVKKGVEDNRWHPTWVDDDLSARTVADRRAFFQRQMGDRINEFTQNSEQVRLLEDRDGDGVYEFSSVFSTGYREIEDGAAAGVLWSNGRLLFTCVPALWELRDADRDAKAESRRALATGFGVHTALFGHDLHGLCEGPDGKIYFSVGDRGLNVETPAGAIVNTDSGAVLRCNADGSQLELFATGLRNPQELAFNEFGDLFTVDNNSDSGDKARLVHVVEGMDAGWRMQFQYLPDRGPFNREKIWHTRNDTQPASIVPPLAHIAKGPSGLVHYPGTGLPAEFAGAFFLVDFLGTSTTSGIHRLHVVPHGATYRLDDFRPFVMGVLATDCDFGPKGDFYVLDWVEGWTGPGSGRVHRITATDATSTQERVATAAALAKCRNAAEAELIGLLGNRDRRVRMAAQKRLVASGPMAIDSLAAAAENKSATLLARLHALWALGELGESNPRAFDAIAWLCGDDDPEVRAQAARAVGRAMRENDARRAEFGARLVKLLTDHSPRVRCFAATSLGTLRYSRGLAALMDAAARDGNDPTLRHAISLGLAGSQSSATLVNAASGADEVQRLVIVVALGKQKSPLVASLLSDKSERVVLEAARIIWDTPLPAADAQLAAMIGELGAKPDPLIRRVLAANVAGRRPQNLRALIQFACRADTSSVLRDLTWELVRTWAAPAPRDSVHGHWRPIAPRPAAELKAALHDALRTLVEVADANPLGLIVAAEFQVDEAYSPLLAVVGDANQPADVRVRAIAAFGAATDATVRQATDAGRTSNDAAVRSAARKLLADRFPDRVVDELKQVLASGTVSEKQAAIDTLATVATPTASALLGEWMDRLEKGTCPLELQVDLLEAADKSADASLVARRKRYYERFSTGNLVDRFANCAVGGDAERGRTIFETNETLSCRRCHSVKPGEVLVGPCLADVGLRRKPEEILESIVTPNATISEGFETAVLQLDTGVVVTGIVRRESDSVIELVDADAKPILVDPKTVEDRVKGVSPMPTNLIEQMTPRELRDLVAYLSQLKAPNSPSNAATGHAE